MAILFTNTDRRVVPNWKSFSKTTRIGELSSFRIESNESPYQIEDYVSDWRLNKSVPFAGDLLSAAVSNNQISSPEVKEAAFFIMSNKDESTISQRRLASAIIDSDKNCTSYGCEEATDETLFDCILSTEQIYNKIAKLKHRISDYPYNPILYVELSRYYTTIGQADQAISAMNTALYLGKDNRFVLRSAARLYLHLKDKERALFVLKKSELTKKDPWLLASEISISTLLKRSSSNIKTGFYILDSNNFSSASISELASSIATLEYINGSNKKSKKLFHKSLIAPNDNSLAQAEWAASKSLINDSDLLNIHNMPKNSFYESNALSSFNRKEYKESIGFASDWIEDMPFAKRPILFASSISTTHLKNYELSEKILKIGLQANPLDAQLINNIAYSCALNNEIGKAENYLAQIKSNFIIDKTTEICLLATRGLVDYRKGLHESGQELYLRAIEKTREYKDSPLLNWTAVLNYAREELMVNSAAKEQLSPLISQIPDNLMDEDTKVLKNEVTILLKN